MLWELTDGKNLYSLEAGDTVNALAFSPSRYWLCAATSSCIKSEFFERELGDEGGGKGLGSWQMDSEGLWRSCASVSSRILVSYYGREELLKPSL